MKKNIFLMNQRFEVDPARNEIRDHEKNVVSKIEPRIMTLLCLLANQNGQVVQREALVEDIWGDYPGGNEGLNQAVSVLRKLLEDEQKIIIKTIPKTGYSFQANVSVQEKVERPQKRANYAGQPFLWVAAVLLILVSFWWNSQKYQKPPNAALSPSEAAALARQDSLNQARTLEQQKLQEEKRE